MTKIKPPVPETKIARLPSFGYGAGLPRWTIHKYVKTMECNLPGPDGEAWEFVYRCEETGAERRWGVVDKDEAIYDGEDESN